MDSPEDEQGLKDFLQLVGRGVDMESLFPQLDMLGVQSPSDLVRLHPKELDGLIGLSVAAKLALMSAIDTIDLAEWLKEWGLESLAGQLDELGVEEPAHAIDLLDEEIEDLETTPIHKLQLIKAIEYLKAETSVVMDSVMQGGEIAEAETQQVYSENQRLREGIESQKRDNLILQTENAHVAGEIQKLSMTNENNRSLVQAAAALALNEAPGLRSLRSDLASETTRESLPSVLTGTQTPTSISALSESRNANHAWLAPGISQYADGDLQHRGDAAAKELVALRAHVANM